jgi:hypothetical protein
MICCISSATGVGAVKPARVGIRNCPWLLGCPLPPIDSCTGSSALSRGGRAVARSLCACRLGFSREFATCEYTCSLFFQTRATQTGVDACHYWFVIGSGVGGVRLKAAPRPLRSDHGAVNNALNSCGQRVDRALLSRYSCALALGCSGALVLWYSRVAMRFAVRLKRQFDDARVDHVVSGFHRTTSIVWRCYHSEIHTSWQLCECAKSL